MHALAVVAPTLFIIALAAAWDAGRPDPSTRLHDWRKTGWLLLAGLLTALIALAMIGAQPMDPWNGARLAPAVSLRFGYQLYYPAETGPVMSTVVGPMAFLAYLPVALLPGSPADLVVAGSFWNLVLLGVSFLLASAAGSLASLDRSERVLVGLLLVQAAVLSPALRYSAFCIHADAPALAGLTSATGLLLIPRREPSRARVWWAAAAAMLALAAKQSLAPALPALIGLTWWAFGARAALRLTIAGATVGAILGVVWVADYGLRTLWSNMVEVPARQPWMQCDLITGEVYRHIAAVSVAARLKTMVAAHLAFIRNAAPLLALLAGWWAWQRRQGHMLRSMASFRCGVLAVCILPGTIAGRLKQGGEINHESFALALVLLAAVCALAELAAVGVRVRPWLVATLVLGLAVNAPYLRDLRSAVHLGASQSDVAYRYLRTHPGRIYFPWNPLSSLLAEGHLYHFDYGVFDRNLGGLTVTSAHLAAHLPGPRPALASFFAHHDYILHTYFSDYVELPPDPLLPGWRLYGPPTPR